jgi:hypothetical protein
VPISNEGRREGGREGGRKTDFKTINLEDLGNKEQTKPQISRKTEVIKTKAEISPIESKRVKQAGCAGIYQ